MSHLPTLCNCGKNTNDSFERWHKSIELFCGTDINVLHRTYQLNFEILHMAQIIITWLAVIAFNLNVMNQGIESLSCRLMFVATLLSLRFDMSIGVVAPKYKTASSTMSFVPEVRTKCCYKWTKNACSKPVNSLCRCIVVSSKWNENSVNSVNSRNLINHWSIIWQRRSLSRSQFFHFHTVFGKIFAK